MGLDSLARGFADLFAGRVDVYGKGGAQGGCVKEPLTYDHYYAHLEGTLPIGVYPQRDDYKVKWGCSDIDVEDFGLAYNIRAALNTLGIVGWIELTRSAHYHVWVFCEQWTTAAVVRRALLVAHELAGVPPKEVNPKQGSLEGMNYGNYVRLPYPGWFTHTRLSGERQVMIVPKGPPFSLEQFLPAAWRRRADHHTLHRAANLYREPEKKAVVLGNLVPLNDTLTTRLNGLAWTVYKDGPLDGDRSAALFKLAAGCKTSGLNPTEALTIVTDADLRWGKYHSRPDGEKWLRRTVERAYQ